MKTCFKCGIFKPIDDFYKHPMMSDGHLGKCKECAKKDVINNRVKRIQYYLKYDTERSKSPHRKALNLKIVNSHKDRRSAHSSVSNSLRNGNLIKQPCEVCGSENTEAHHDDYSKPMDVRWLCFKHHRQLHGQKFFASDLVSSNV